MQNFPSSGARLNGNLGSYVIEKEIARGGMGAIFQARNLADQSVVAIKSACLDPEICRDQRVQIREQLIREMEALAHLDHPNIPKVFEHFSTFNNEYLVMEFISGCTVMQIQQRTLRESRLLEESRVLGWAIQILDALDYLHSQLQPVIHRDVKPENLILSPDGRVMLIDFGLMKQLERQIEIAAGHYDAVGTVEYAPPEQYGEMDWGMDARSDLYSLGATLYYLLSGRLPPRAAQRIIPGTVNLSYKLPPLSQYNPTVKPATQQVIFKALEFDPGHRFPSARRMREALLPPRRYFLLPF